MFRCSPGERGADARRQGAQGVAAGAGQANRVPRGREPDSVKPTYGPG